MSVTESLPELLSRFKSRRSGLTRREIERVLDCSASTARRYIERLRELGNEIVRDGDRYRLDGEARVELPGVVFRPEELAALLGLEHWLESLGSGILKGKLDPVRTRLEEMLRAAGVSPGDWKDRIRLLPMHFRRADPDTLVAVTAAVLGRRKLEVEYRGFRDRELRVRRVSPQTLVRYRDGWSLDAWCHSRRGLRQFVLGRMRNVRILDETAKEVPREKLTAHFAESYGIFAGRARGRAVLEFEGDAARIVREETWHPAQRTRDLPEGRFRLEFPCGDVRELARDVMRFADEVTVVSPPALREAVAGMVRRANGRLDGTLRD